MPSTNLTGLYFPHSDVNMQPQLLKHLIQKPVMQEQLAPMSDPVSFPAIRTAGRDNETFMPICTASPASDWCNWGNQPAQKAHRCTSRPVTLYQREGQGPIPPNVYDPALAPFASLPGTKARVRPRRHPCAYLHAHRQWPVERLRFVQRLQCVPTGVPAR
jgi:hypothetical protein